MPRLFSIAFAAIACSRHSDRHGVRRAAAAIAHPTRRDAGCRGPVVSVSACRAPSRRARMWNGSATTATRAPARYASASATSAPSGDTSRLSLLDESLLMELGEEGHDVGLASLGCHVVAGAELRHEVGDRRRLLEPLPYRRGDVVEQVVLACVDVH